MATPFLFFQPFATRTTNKTRTPPGCSKRPSSKAAASEEVKPYFMPYVESLSDARTPLADFFNSLLF